MLYYAGQGASAMLILHARIIKKVFGRKKSLRSLVDKFEERYNKESDIIYITHPRTL